MNRSWQRTLLVGAAVVTMAGCSQAAQFAPVAGDAVTSVRIATIDVALDQGLQFSAAPVCTYEGTEYDCQGTLSDSRELISTATQVAKPDVPTELAGQIPADATDDDTFIVLDVSVAGSPIYRGLANAVLDENGRVGQ
jgi:hypothetical protein